MSLLLLVAGIFFIVAGILYFQFQQRHVERTIASHRGCAYTAAKTLPRNTAIYRAGIKQEQRRCSLNQDHLLRLETEDEIVDHLLKRTGKYLDKLELESRIGRELNLREKEKFQHQQFMFELQQKFLESTSPPPQPKAFLKGVPGTAPINIEVSSEPHQADTEHQGRMKQAEQDYEYNNFRNQKDIELKAHKAELIHQKVKEWESQGIPEDEIQRMRMDFIRLDNDDEMNQ